MVGDGVMCIVSNVGTGTLTHTHARKMYRADVTTAAYIEAHHKNVVGRTIFLYRFQQN